MTLWSTRIALIIALLALVACGTPTANPSATGSFGPVANQPHSHAPAQTGGTPHDHGQIGSTTPDHAAATATTSELQVVLATSEVVVGPNRLALGLLQDNVPISDAPQTTVTARYYRLSADQATLVGEETARYYGEGLGPRGTFVIHPTFDAPGQWGLEVEATRPGQAPVTRRLRINVVEHGNAPKVGDAAPRSDTPTAAQVSDLRQISSDAHPDPRLYQMSVAQAVSSGKPSLILFATPGYCQTAVCGPGVEVVKRLVDRFGDRVNAVHVEVYRLPYDGTMVPAMREWGLLTEPWLFLVDGQGKIAARYEGGITLEELQPAVEQVIGGQAGS